MKHLLITATLATSAALAATPALAAGYTETFSNVTPSNAAYSSGVIPGTALEVTSGYVWAAAGDPAPNRGNFLDLASGWYSSNFDNTSNVGSSSVRSVETFDLIAGYVYTLSFDYSRQGFSAGNGPFYSSITGALGSHSVSYDEVVGFYYGMDWKSGGVTWTQQATELGARVTFVASGPAGYSGMAIDNVSMVGLAPVPEPTTWALMLAGLAAVSFGARRRAAVSNR